MQQEYLKIISGRRTGLWAAFVKALLVIISAGYSAVINLRNFLYSKQLLKTHKVNAVVISIGNITTGGTGKTPLVIWLCNFLSQQNISAAVLTRGYKIQNRATSDERRVTITDEPALLARNCTNAKVVINPDRVSAAQDAINKFNAKCLILDDGFQHRRLARNLDIVTVDVTEPFGYGRLLPAGLLREPVSSLKRADAVVLTHCDLQRSRRLEEIEEQIREKNAGLIIAKSIHQPVSIVFSNGKEIPAEQLAGKKVFAFCGIASPEDFFRTIENLAARIIGREIFDDHYHYSEKDISRICKSAADSKAALVITTEKDWTKITHLNLDKNLNFAYLRIKIHFIEGLEQLTDLIEKAFEGKISRSMNSP